MSLTLYIGNKNYSSWSLRPWLAMRMADIPFREVIIPLDRPETADSIAKISPNGRVPCLHSPDGVISESLAILEYLAEILPSAGLWPGDRAARACARAVASEMHSGFTALRTECPMNLRRGGRTKSVSADAQNDIARIEALWQDCRTRFGPGGAFLFGAFSNADAMFAPVVARIIGYGISVGSEAQAYCETIWHLPAMQEWRQAGIEEEWEISASDNA